MNTTDLAWFKSTYSSGEGGECLEVAFDWRKSSYSGGEGGQCVGVANCAHSVHIRDSKIHAGPQLAITPSAWSAFLGGVTEASA
ncbi:DUF397 domain-containing protein [Streptomyces sp. NBC_01264]|uniref:DUF397 domain-containing protein n=1 Tax=Streptomyces sp. NBC_01264 TaxID=2903804 RepID=UPI00224E1E81|nr:DUF397 domain-containing protein [Streptomyces sp. NBC_01264]MCX4780316.1 DUF397 domain-containing protein [Streptomyces sp. NBC_01264]